MRCYTPIFFYNLLHCSSLDRNTKYPNNDQPTEISFGWKQNSNNLCLDVIQTTTDWGKRKHIEINLINIHIVFSTFDSKILSNILLYGPGMKIIWVIIWLAQLVWPHAGGMLDVSASQPNLSWKLKITIIIFFFPMLLDHLDIHIHS